MPINLDIKARRKKREEEGWQEVKSPVLRDTFRI